MWNEPGKEELAAIPRFDQTEEIPLKDKLIHLHFFIGGCDWYIAEYDGEDLFWCFAILNGDMEMAEWGYISFEEIKSLKIGPAIEVDRDLAWMVKPAFQVQKIKEAQLWLEDEPW